MEVGQAMAEQQLGVWGPQQWGEPVEEARDEFADFVKNPERHVLLSAKDYVAGHLGIDLYVWRWTSRRDADPSHYVAHCRSVGRMDDLAFEVPHSVADLVGEFAINEGAHIHDRDRGVGVDKQGGMNFSVLVSVGESGQDGQEQNLIVPSVISLASLSFLGGLRADMLEIAMLPEPLRGQVGEDREHDVPGLVLGGFSPEVVYRQLPPKVVKGTAHVVDGVSDHETPVVADLGNALRNPENEVVLGVKLPPRGENSGWTLSIACSEDCSPEVFYVALCARQLRPTPSQSLGG
jgi:hypothetical protein